MPVGPVAGWSRHILTGRALRGLPEGAPKEALTQLLTRNRLRWGAFDDEALAQRLYQELGTKARAGSVPDGPGNNAYELPLYLTQLYGDFWAGMHAKRVVDPTVFQQVIGQELKRLAAGKEPSTSAGWTLKDFGRGSIRSSTQQEAAWLLAHDGPKRITELFERFTAELSSARPVGKLAPALRLTPAQAAQAVDRFEVSLAAAPTPNLRAKPLSARDRSALVAFAEGKRPFAKLQDAGSWFDISGLHSSDRLGLEKALDPLGPALHELLVAMEPQLGSRVNYVRSKVFFDHMSTPFFHVDSAEKRPQNIVMRALVPLKGAGTLGIADGRVFQLKEGELLVFFGEPARRLKVPRRTPLTHSSPAIETAAGRRLGMITLGIPD